MQRTKNNDVIKAWKAGIPARNGKNTLWTTGKQLYSYQLQIGVRTDSGVTVLADYTAATRSFRSQTTSCHVCHVLRAGVDLVMHPMVWQASPLSKDNEEVPF
jgi:hypothetical protein